MTDELVKNVKFSGNLSVRDEMLELVDDAIKSQGTIDGLGDMSAGLSGISQEHKVKIIDEDDSLAVVVTGTDSEEELCRFVIDKKTKTVYQAVNDVAEEVSIDEDMDFLDDI